MKPTTLNKRIKTFFSLNWRIMLLLLLLVFSILFILWSNNQVDENFTHVFDEQTGT